MPRFYVPHDHGAQSGWETLLCQATCSAPLEVPLDNLHKCMNKHRSAAPSRAHHCSHCISIVSPQASLALPFQTVPCVPGPAAAGPRRLLSQTAAAADGRVKPTAGYLQEQDTQNQAQGVNSLPGLAALLLTESGLSPSALSYKGRL
jgi:hypothetical protein